MSTHRMLDTVTVFPFRLRLAMEKGKINIKELAEATGVSVTCVWSWLNGVHFPTAPNLAYACYVLNVSSDWIIGLDMGKEATA